MMFKSKPMSLSKPMLIPKLAFKVLSLFLLSVIMAGCASILQPNREFAEPLTGSVIIAKNIFKDNKGVGCDSKTHKAKVACEKQVNDLAKSISDAKVKSQKNNHDQD
jgi:hypothetical protein